MKKKKLAIISTHPIQYNAPVFRALAQSAEIQPKVFYTWSQSASGTIFDPGFGVELQWDIPLLEGYAHEFIPNVAKRPGIKHVFGIRNPGLKKAVSEWDADAVLIYGWNFFSHLQLMRQLKGRIPIFFRGDSTLLDVAPPLRRFARKLALTWVYKHIDIAIAVGQNNADYFAWCGIPWNRIAFAPHSIDTRRFIGSTKAHAEQIRTWRKQLGIGRDDFVFVYAGKFISKKDPVLLIDAFMQLSASAHLVFFGDGELARELETRASGHSAIHFLPFQNQSAMPAVYRLGNVFVLPSRGPGETWGLALNEAMASGRPVISGSKAGAARDLIMPGVNGWIFESGNLRALIAALQTAIDYGRDRLLEMGCENQKISRNWSSEDTARRFTEIVHGDLSSRRGSFE